MLTYSPAIFAPVGCATTIDRDCTPPYGESYGLHRDGGRRGNRHHRCGICPERCRSCRLRTVRTRIRPSALCLSRPAAAVRTAVAMRPIWLCLAAGMRRRRIHAATPPLSTARRLWVLPILKERHFALGTEPRNA